MRFALIAVIAAARIAAAAPALTIIQDTLFKADGTRFDGVAQIEWKSFQAADGSEVPQQSVNVQNQVRDRVQQNLQQGVNRSNNAQQ